MPGTAEDLMNDIGMPMGGVTGTIPSTSTGSSILNTINNLVRTGVGAYLAVSSRDIQSQQIKAGMYPTSTQGLNVGQLQGITSAFGSYLPLILVGIVLLILLLRR